MTGTLNDVFTEMDGEDDRPEVKDLFARLKSDMPRLEKLLMESERQGEDRIYRLYHQSFKVFDLQFQTLEIVKALQNLAPDRQLNEWFLQIVREGTGKTFKSGDNENWLAVTKPIVEAFFHARYFLAMAVKYGKEVEFPPKLLPGGWAGVLYLYNLR